MNEKDLKMACQAFSILKRAKGAGHWCQSCKREHGLNGVTFADSGVPGVFKIICERTGLDIGEISLIGGDASEE